MTIHTVRPVLLYGDYLQFRPTLSLLRPLPKHFVMKIKHYQAVESAHRLLKQLTSQAPMILMHNAFTLTIALTT